MSVLACATHWYVSAMFVAPVLTVGGWCWWKSRDAPQDEDQPSPPATAR